MTVAVLGASKKEGRYSNKAVKMLLDHDHKVIPIHPLHQEIEGQKVVSSLRLVNEEVDTLTLYVGSAHLENETDSIISLNPKRVIFNPGTENPKVQQALTDKGISWVEACTLVLLSTGQFETAGF